MHSWEKGTGWTPFGHSKSWNILMLYFLRNSWYANFTKFHPTILGNLVLCSGSNTFFGFWVIRNLTLGTWSPKNSTSSLTCLDNGMTSLLALVRSNMQWASATEPSGSSCSLNYLLKWSCHIRLTTLLKSAVKIPTHHNFKFNTGALGYCVIHYFNQVCIDLVVIYGPIFIL